MLANYAHKINLFARFPRCVGIIHDDGKRDAEIIILVDGRPLTLCYACARHLNAILKQDLRELEEAKKGACETERQEQL